MKHLRKYELFESMASPSEKIIVVKFISESIGGNFATVGVARDSTLQRTFHELLVKLWDMIDGYEEFPWDYQIQETATEDELRGLLQDWSDEEERHDFLKIEVRIFDVSSLTQKDIDAINMARRIEYKPKLSHNVGYADAFDVNRKTDSEIMDIVDNLYPSAQSMEIFNFITEKV
jgi:hypothetical protein